MSKPTLRLAPALTRPELVRAAQRLANLEILSFYRAMAAPADPARFSMPADRNAAEYVYAKAASRRTLAQLAPVRRKAVAELSLPPATLALRYPGVGTLNFKAAESLQVQARRAAGGVTPRGDLEAQPPGNLDAQPRGVSSVQLAINMVALSCERETSKGFPEVDPDSIDVASSLFDVRNPLMDTVAFNAGRDFRTGTAKRYQPALLLGAVNVPVDQIWPKVYSGNVFMLERDDGGTAGEDMKVVFNRVRDEVARWVAEGAGGLLSSFVGPEIGQVIGQFIGEVVKAIANAIFGAFGNDPFRVQTVTLAVPDAASLSNLEPVTQTLRFEDNGGIYLMNVSADWRRLDVPLMERRFNALEVRIGTGGDDLRGNSTGWAAATFTDGTEARVSINNGDGLPGGTQRVFTIGLPSGVTRQIRELKHLTIHHHSNNGFLQTDDNWNLDSVRVRTNGPDAVTEVLAASGGPLKRFTGQDHDLVLAFPR